MKKFVLLFITGALMMGCHNDEPTPVPPSVELSESAIEVWFNQNEHSVEIEATHEWTATSDSEWIVLIENEGVAGRTELKFSVSQNEEAETRTGTIVVENEQFGLSESLSITQLGLKNEYKEITYTTINGRIVTPFESGAFDVEIESNTYENGKGTIRFKSGVVKVGESAFYGNENLKSIALPNSIVEIAGWAFSDCVYLENITLGNRVKSIGNSAFGACVRLKEITIPESVETIGESAFYDCSAMTAFKGKFASEDNRCLIIDNVLINFAPKDIKEYKIADGITDISAMAFYNSRLTSVTIPQSVVSIGEWAFYYSENLKSVYCKATTPPALGGSAFDNSENGIDKPIGCKIYVPTKAVNDYKSAENWSRYKNDITGYNF